jgi:hypothetical protein
MAWESGISYNAALADAVREALESKDITWLATALANDKYARIFNGNYNPKHTRAFDRYLTQFSTLPHDILVDACMDCVTRTNTANNGGSVIWIDKKGCSTVELS